LRSRGTLPDSLRIHSLQPGGGNLRGYFNQNIPSKRTLATNIELRFPLGGNDPLGQIPIFRTIFSKLTGVLFFDGAQVSENAFPKLSNKFIYDAGIGIRFAQIPSQTNLFSSIGLNVIRVDFPLFVSNPLAGEEKFKFRWVMTFTEIL